jgi:hypothetical protein
MFPLLFALAVDPFPHLPPVWDAERFPTADACAEQRRRWKGHCEWLDGAALAWPERREQFAAWGAQAEHARFLWDVLLEAAEAGESDWRAEEGKRECLGRWRYWVGDENYRTGWLPPALPADLHPEPAEFAPAGADR